MSSNSSQFFDDFTPPPPLLFERPILGPVSLRRHVLCREILNLQPTTKLKKNDENAERHKFIMQRIVGPKTALDERTLGTIEVERADRAQFIRELMLATIQLEDNST